MPLKNFSFVNLVAISQPFFFAASLAFSTAVSAEKVKVAFMGDQSAGETARSVLQLVADEGTDLLMIQGDLGYGVKAAVNWEANLNDALGRNFPVLVVVGNHENFEWPLYQSYTRQRIDRAGGLSCSGNIGVKAVCKYRNLDIVQVASGINEVAGVSGDDNYADFIRSSFAGSSDRWRICSWHKNQNALQTGSKGDSTGWDVYDACLDAGAMIAVAHEHAYSRTYLLSDYENQTVVHRNSDMTLQPGQSFMFVSGLGGREVRPQKRGGDWWASIYTATQGATHGALFCEFDDDVAKCYFKAVDGSIPDQFTVRRGSQAKGALAKTGSVKAGNKNAGITGRSARAQSQSVGSDGYVFSRTDKEEYRWIDRTRNGELGNIWIDRSCADQLGGPSAYGDWDDLYSQAPAMDVINSPCSGNNSSTSITPSTHQGYVFSRSDKAEYRWIDRNDSGEMGSTWIDHACATRLGGPVATGDWGDLLDAAPAMDSIASPCLEQSGYVFSRTDVVEFRWIEQDGSGVAGNIWIEPGCAERLGGATKTGDWHDLNLLAPRFDAIPDPC